MQSFIGRQFIPSSVKAPLTSQVRGRHTAIESANDIANLLKNLTTISGGGEKNDVGSLSDLTKYNKPEDRKLGDTGTEFSAFRSVSGYWRVAYNPEFKEHFIQEILNVPANGEGDEFLSKVSISTYARDQGTGNYCAYVQLCIDCKGDDDSSFCTSIPTARKPSSYTFNWHLWNKNKRWIPYVWNYKQDDFGNTSQSCQINRIRISTAAPGPGCVSEVEQVNFELYYTKRNPNDTHSSETTPSQTPDTTQAQDPSPGKAPAQIPGNETAPAPTPEGNTTQSVNGTVNISVAANTATPSKSPVPTLAPAPPPVPSLSPSSVPVNTSETANSTTTPSSDRHTKLRGGHSPSPGTPSPMPLTMSSSDETVFGSEESNHVYNDSLIWFIVFGSIGASGIGVAFLYYLLHSSVLVDTESAKSGKE